MIVADSNILSSFAAAKVKTMIVQMNKVEGLVFKTTREIFAD